MATIKLTDQFGLSLDAQPAPASALLKYFQQLPSLKLDSLDLEKTGGLTLDQPALRSLRTGLSFESPVDLGEVTPSLSVDAGAHASINIIQDADGLPGSGDDVKGQTGTCYLSFAVDGVASAKISGKAAGIAFGASPSTSLKFASYSRFPVATPLLDALRQTVCGMILPAKSADLANLAPGQIATVDMSGKVQLSGSIDLLATTNPLASASLPAPLPAVSVTAGGSATVGVSFEIDAEFEIVARKLDSGVVRLGWHRKNAESLSVTASVSGSMGARIGSSDVFTQVIGAISSNAKADIDELSRGGLTAQRAEDIQAAVKAAISRRLEIAVSAGLSAGKSNSAVLLYEIDPAKWTEASRQAIDQALHGDLAGMHAGLLPGVTCVRSIWDDVRRRGLDFAVNLLGILNYRSVAQFTLAGQVLFEPATGALVITDKATADRIRSTSVNFGADTQKLRHVMAESFLITAAYHGAHQAALRQAATGAVSLRCSHSFFDLRNSTARTDMARNLRTGVALGLLNADEAELPDGVADFGRTMYFVSADYDSDLVDRMFLDSNGAPQPPELYETAGRTALQFLIQPDDDDAVRRQPAIDNMLWSRMKAVGQPGFHALFKGISEPLVAAIVADYSTIMWWADVMSRTARELTKVRRWEAGHVAVSFDDPEFRKLHQDLAGYLRKVAATTREEFGAPWGLIAMNQLTGPRAGARILINGPKLGMDKRRALTAVTGP